MRQPDCMIGEERGFIGSLHNQVVCPHRPGWPEGADQPNPIHLYKPKRSIFYPSQKWRFLYISLTARPFYTTYILMKLKSSNVHHGNQVFFFNQPITMSSTWSRAYVCLLMPSTHKSGRQSTAVKIKPLIYVYKFPTGWCPFACQCCPFGWRPHNRRKIAKPHHHYSFSSEQLRVIVVLTSAVSITLTASGLWPWMMWTSKESPLRREGLVWSVYRLS